MMNIAFQDFQRDLACHLRDPHHVRRPKGVAPRPAALYGELVFGNLCGFLDACFPVCREILGEARWRRLHRAFLRDWPLRTPWFREIPAQFVRYLADAPITQSLPRWLAQLAHYEWTELAVDTLDCAAPAAQPAQDLLAGPLCVNPALMVCHYDWPVHRIHAGWRPRVPRPTVLAVYRDHALDVRFCEINTVTAQLLEDLREPHRCAADVVLKLAATLHHPDPARLLEFAAPLLQDLQAQGILLGVPS